MNEINDAVLRHVHEKVEHLFLEFPVLAHGYDHATRVGEYASHIAKKEGVDPMTAELAGVLHDIGRVPEQYPEAFPQFQKDQSHHELSYQLLRDWFLHDSTLRVLDEVKKLELLYAVRYHWNDVADEYDTAIIVRDADKLDMLGDIGVSRLIEWVGREKNITAKDFWLRYYCVELLRTDIAKRIVVEHSLLEPVEVYMKKLLAREITQVEL
jgi:putative nucleotidyltransferase with HDIG domain